jgi:hypothetical protein
MTCEETLTLDLAEFLARGTAPEFAAFREHYPRCADCAAEVRAWTELHAALATPTHPSPETLLHYQDDRLPRNDRGTVTRHLAACAPCRDELRALAAFDRDAKAAAPAPAVVEERPRWFHRLRPLVLHPAVAYGLVLALLFYPALTNRSPAPPPSADRDDAAGTAAPAAKLADRPAAAPREEPATPPERRALQRLAAEAPAAARAKTESAEREADAAGMDSRLDAASLRAESVVVPLGPDDEPRLKAATATDEVTLQMPVRPALRTGSLEIRVIHRATERELRQRVTPAERVDVRVPRAWLEPGRYRVEVRSAGAEAEIDVFTFAVDG